MFLNLNHKLLDIYKLSGLLVNECYKLTCALPPEERFNLVQQVRRAALSVKLNIAEGASRKSENERKRYFEIARGSIIEIEAALEILVALNYTSEKDLESTGHLIIRCFSMLSKLTSNH